MQNDKINLCKELLSDNNRPRYKFPLKDCNFTNDGSVTVMPM